GLATTSVSGARAPALPISAAPAARHAPQALDAYPASGAVAVTGHLRCADHPAGCDAWITVVNDRGKRRAGVRAVGGRYRVAGLEPGRYTLIASGAAHPPRAEYLSVQQRDGELRHDIELDAARHA
ncbi:FUSC family protein, partial [Streptomyces bomunensis]|nr:FUSC family protein [Streptomyces montanisoli]